ncbi:carbamoyl-phosphate synthase large subunit [Oligosphaera ethanolica]|uniref:Carbamoyl-phosphate synthase large subunit n=1 Tax=Oligosphaera ethanolica TaxID=760260 RepID=A0AAE4AMC2_9BACT|nr:carbamoyl-phosphate synthase large subunit [Oligosphaera ethanolica]MDQ0288341.1 carbamoyl-phosphate synthase large subunit [Oligosphaera ethanolica]
MPKRNDIHKVMIIGSGPIIIGQACEFDYSGTQACKALRSLGYSIVLVNSNPATIMTDPGIADATYIEPLNVARMEEIIDKERPDALLPNLGGQSALNLASELAKNGVFEKYNVKVIGVQIDAIERGEDRTAFKNTMDALGIDMARSQAVNTVEDAEAVAKNIGFPVVVRPAYTMGGTGGGFCYNVDELRTIAARGLQASMVHQILIEESLLGWEELELEVVRDTTGHMITVCFIENVDAVGVHTGDSFCTAPMLTISQELQAKMQEWSYRIVEGIGVIGGTNVQFAHNPKTDRTVVIEINPRTSRSSALASKATGFPIAYVSALLAAGITLDELPYWRDGSLDKYTPSGDYVVVKFARWAFEKFKGVQDKLGTQMRAVGEVMSIGKTYKEAFLKAIRSLESGNPGLGFVKNFNQLSLDEIMDRLNEPSSVRHFLIYEALRKGATIADINAKTYIKAWFLEQMQELVELETQILAYRDQVLPDELLVRAKKDGFSDLYLAKLLKTPEAVIRKQRLALGLCQAWDKVPVSGVENAYYCYSTYNGENKVAVTSNPKKVMVLGGGPNRIGQGIEFDYCCVHAAFAMREMGYETIIVNCNPETVSTDYDTSDRLYFEPLTLEDVLSIYQQEKPLGVIVQFGGQTPLNLAADLERNGVNILGTPPAVIDMAEDRDLFRKMMDKLAIPMPTSDMASTTEEAMAIAPRIGYPLMVRPSFVLGGRGMEVVRDDSSLRQYMAAAVDVTPERPILIDKFLENALECEADAIADGHEAFVPSVMEHIELAGIHSGDSACVIPPISITPAHLATIRDYTARIAREMGVVGLMNIQYAICQDTVYVLEANPRASRTVPLVSKVCGISMAKLATQAMMGTKIADMKLTLKHFPHFGVKEAVFPFAMLPEVDPILGPEMRSTGEVLGLASSFGLAFYKAEEAAKPPLPSSGTVLITVHPADREGVLAPARQFAELGFRILATDGTCKYLNGHGVKAETIAKITEGRPNIVDVIKNGEIQLVINTPIGKESATDDSYIRKTAIRHGVPYITTVAAANAAAYGIAAFRNGDGGVMSLQEYHANIH